MTARLQQAIGPCAADVDPAGQLEVVRRMLRYPWAVDNYLRQARRR